MIKEILPFSYSGTLQAPSSKSYLQRAIAIACLANGKSQIHGYTKSNDAEIALKVARQFGTEIKVEKNIVFIERSELYEPEFVAINCGEAGLSTRMFSPIAAALFQSVEVSGSGSILVRPMDMVIDALEQLGAEVNSNSDCLPLSIKGGINPGEIRIDGSESSQLLTGLLIALPVLNDDSVIHVDNLTSIPYVQMTLDILSDFGIEIANYDFKSFHIRGNQKPVSRNYVAEGDWSGASFHVVGAAISGKIELKGLNINSSQADRAILEAVELAGATVETNSESVIVTKDQLEAFEFDATQCPDLFPPLAALAACCDGVTRIIGTDRLTHKESNRALTIQSELFKLGIKVELKENSMEVTGGPIIGGTISSNNDHRIAMMAAILASVSSSSISIENSEAINKSYPEFYLDLSRIS